MNPLSSFVLVLGNIISSLTTRRNLRFSVTVFLDPKNSSWKVGKRKVVKSSKGDLLFITGPLMSL